MQLDRGGAGAEPGRENDPVPVIGGRPHEQRLNPIE